MKRICLFLVLILVICGGIWIDRRQSLSGEHDFNIEKMSGSISFRSTESEFSIPFVCHYYGQHMPAHLFVRLEDSSGESQRAVIDEITLTDQATSLKQTGEWRHEFKNYGSYVWNEAKGEAEPDKTVVCEGRTPLSLSRFGEYRVILKGRIINAENKETRFTIDRVVILSGTSWFQILPWNYVRVVESVYKT